MSRPSTDSRRGPTLVERMRAGDPTAARILESDYRPAIVRYAYGMLGDAAAAEDAAQDVFVKALSSRSVPESVRPWLYRIARNHCLNLLRGRREEQLPSRAGFTDSRTGQLTRLLRAENEAELRRRLEKLTPDQREVLELRYGEDLGREEIALVLDLPPSIVKSRLYEAMKRLRSMS
ncbi:MAG: sigma-70 family RNA polymerase sigma factor [Planctomycetota bacterium]